MAFKMLLHFTGLCAFVAKKSIDQNQNEATVILVNARHSHHAPHRAIFLAAPENFATDNQRYISAPFLHGGISKHACALGGEALTIAGRDINGQRVPLADDALSFLTGLRPTPPAPCPDFGSPTNPDGDDKDFSWVCKNPGTLNPDVLTSTSMASLIAARLKLTEGTLTTESFRVIDNNRLVRFKFGSANSQAFSEEVTWVLDFSAQSGVVDVVLDSTPFDNLPANPSLILKPRTDIDLLEGWIVNMPVENLFSLDPPLPLAPDDHYEEYYRLCKGTPPTDIPIPDTQNFCTGPSGATNPKCPPTYFA